MKLVLSRKGFDSSYGGMPSPILPDGRLVPLPIPSRHDRSTFRDLNLGDAPIAALLGDLSGEVHSAEGTVHLDPDLDRVPSRRLPGWLPSLGQSGAAQSHLGSQGVGRGDVFLFFGWFRQVGYRNGSWQFLRNAPHAHVIFGWLEVDQVLPIVSSRRECLRDWPWIADHPHVASPKHYDNPLNTLYVGATISRYNAKAEFGGGLFKNFDAGLQLTKSGASRSVWSLPGWFFPGNERPPLTYHGNPERWSMEGDRVTLNSVAKGQEFILDCNQYPQAEAWLRQTIALAR